MKLLVPGAALSAALLLSCAAFAGTPAAAAVDVRSSLPVPVSVVHPTNLPLRFKDTTVQVVLTIDAQGVPHDVSAAGGMPADFAKQLLPVVAQWRFSPMYENGKAVAARVILPIELTEES
jgi:outer membrane biosynthesis protein TonB